MGLSDAEPSPDRMRHPQNGTNHERFRFRICTGPLMAAEGRLVDRGANRGTERRGACGARGCGFGRRAGFGSVLRHARMRAGGGAGSAAAIWNGATRVACGGPFDAFPLCLRRPTGACRLRGAAGGPVWAGRPGVAGAVVLSWGARTTAPIAMRTGGPPAPLCAKSCRMAGPCTQIAMSAT